MDKTEMHGISASSTDLRLKKKEHRSLQCLQSVLTDNIFHTTNLISKMNNTSSSSLCLDEKQILIHVWQNSHILHVDVDMCFVSGELS